MLCLRATDNSFFMLNKAIYRSKIPEIFFSQILLVSVMDFVPISIEYIPLKIRRYNEKIYKKFQ